MKKIIKLLFFCCSFQVMADNLRDSNALFDWAETHYPEYFSPSGTETTEFENYLIRHYEHTNIYLGTQGNLVSVYGDQFGGLLPIGEISDFIQSTPAAGFLYTTEYLNGKKFYRVSMDEEINLWSYLVWEFTDTTSTEYTIENPSDSFTVSYTITDEGFITYNDDNTENDYIKALEITDDYIVNITAYGLENIYYKHTSESNYFFFDEKKAQDFIDTKNAEMGN